MLKQKLSFFIISLSLISYANSQIKITSIDKLRLDNTQEWSFPRFSPDGKVILFSNIGYNGIWEYSTIDKSVIQITNDPGSGYGYDISNDGNEIVYRKTIYGNQYSDRKQEIVHMNRTTQKTNILDTGKEVSLPIFINSNIIYSIKMDTKNLILSKGSKQRKILDIENTKIAMLDDGKKLILDPFENGSYIWASLSPDKNKILAYEMSHGAFIYNLFSKNITILGKKNYPVWTRDSKWIVYMDDKDDGQRILSSDIFCISQDGKKNIQITNTEDIIELYPSCSPTENKIVCCSLNGDIYILNYEEME